MGKIVREKKGATISLRGQRSPHLQEIKSNEQIATTTFSTRRKTSLCHFVCGSVGRLLFFVLVLDWRLLFLRNWFIRVLLGLFRWG